MSAYQEIVLPYGHETRTVRVPSAHLAWVASPKDVPPVDDLPAAVRDAIRAPIGASSLSELVDRRGTRTVIRVDDGTRSTPQKEILPVLLEELNAAGHPTPRSRC